MTADLFERGLNETRSIFIHKSLNQDLQNFLQLATNNVDVTDVIVTKFTGFEEVEENLTKLMQIAIVREAEDNEDVLEEEVKAANQLLHLLADWDRRGSLLCVMLCKVAFSKWLTKNLLSGCAAPLHWLGGEAGREGEGGADGNQHRWRRPGALCTHYQQRPGQPQDVRQPMKIVWSTNG